MAIRYTVQEALQKGMISPETARSIRKSVSPLKARKKPSGNDPQMILLNAIRAAFPGWDVRSEWPAGVPDRKFRIDIAFPAARLACEVDGFQYHRSLAAFKSDRSRQNLLTIQGWRVLRFFPGEIFNQMPECIHQIDLALNAGIEPPLAMPL